MKYIITGILALVGMSSRAQIVSTFETILTTAETYQDSAASADGFVDGDAAFSNHYNGYWSGGFAISNTTDVTTAGWLNSYSAFPGAGAKGSSAYAVAWTGGVVPHINIINGADAQPLQGVFVTNTTYAALSMQQGDQFAKKFGGNDGSDPDWFLLDIIGHLNGAVADTVQFYLADYRFENDEEDYIIEDWTWVDLSALGIVDSLSFELSSTDNGDWGMNTPGYFALDNFNAPINVGVEEVAYNQSLKVFPNPAKDLVSVETESGFELIDLLGSVVLSTGNATADISHLPTGLYYVKSGTFSTPLIVK